MDVENDQDSETMLAWQQSRLAGSMDVSKLAMTTDNTELVTLKTKLLHQRVTCYQRENQSTDQDRSCAALNVRIETEPSVAH